MAPPPLSAEISWLEAGDPDGRRVILLHGTPGKATQWNEFLAAPPDGIGYIAIDRPGFGESMASGAAVSLAEQAAAIEPFLTESGGGWPILVGHSLGGPIVAAAAARWPDRIGGVIILAGSLDPDLEKVWWIQRAGNAAPLRWLLPSGLKHANQELIALEDELRSLADRLDRITAPTIILHGTKDRLVPYENVAFMRREMTGTGAPEVITLEGVDHFLPWTHQAEIEAAILKLAAPER